MQMQRWARKSVPADFNPYNAEKWLLSFLSQHQVWAQGLSKLFQWLGKLCTHSLHLHISLQGRSRRQALKQASHFHRIRHWHHPKQKSFLPYAPHNKAVFTIEIFHFHVENNVATNKLLPNWHLFVFIQYLERNSYALHLFINGVRPKGIAISLVNIEWMLCRLRHLDSKFVSFLKVTRTSLFNKRNDMRPFLNYVRHISVKGRLTVNSLRNSILGSLNWMWFLDIRKICPGHQAILSLSSELPNLGWTSVIRYPPFFSLLVCVTKSSSWAAKINNGIK